MKNKKVMELINTQINHEMYSAYLYLDFCRFMSEQGYLGFANWYAIQAREEVDHAMIFFKYLIDENAHIELNEISKPSISDETVAGILAQGLEHETFVTALIDNIYCAAEEAKDYRTMSFLDWFIEEQAEEERNANDLINKYSFVSEDLTGIYMMDKELMDREYSAPDISW